jgi:hypothetical protein
MSPVFANEVSNVESSSSVTSDPNVDPNLPTTEVPTEEPVVEPVTEPLLGAEPPMAFSIAPTFTLKQTFTVRSKEAFAQARLSAPFTYKSFYKTPRYARWYGKNHIRQRYGWGTSQYKCLNSLWTTEAHWNYRARGRANAFLGIPQMYRNTVKANGVSIVEFMNSPELQIQLGARYIKFRYGTACKALKFFKRHHWY